MTRQPCKKTRYALALEDAHRSSDNRFYTVPTLGPMQMITQYSCADVPFSRGIVATKTPSKIRNTTQVHFSYHVYQKITAVPSDSNSLLALSSYGRQCISLLDYRQYKDAKLDVSTQYKLTSFTVNAPMFLTTNRDGKLYYEHCDQNSHLLGAIDLHSLKQEDSVRLMTVEHYEICRLQLASFSSSGDLLIGDKLTHKLYIYNTSSMRQTRCIVLKDTEQFRSIATTTDDHAVVTYSERIDIVDLNTAKVISSQPAPPHFYIAVDDADNIVVCNPDGSRKRPSRDFRANIAIYRPSRFVPCRTVSYHKPESYESVCITQEGSIAALIGGTALKIYE